MGWIFLFLCFVYVRVCVCVCLCTLSLFTLFSDMKTESSCLKIYLYILVINSGWCVSTTNHFVTLYITVITLTIYD